MVKRKPAFYENNVFVMLCAITTVAFSSFRVGGRNDLSQNLENTLTMIFTAAAFRFSLEGKLPVVNYLTVLDKYLLPTIVFMIIIVAMLVVKVMFPGGNWPKSVMFGGWVMHNVVFVVRRVLYQRKVDQVLASQGLRKLTVTDSKRSVELILCKFIAHRIQSTSRLSHMLRASTHVFVRAGCEYDLAAATYRVPLPLHLQRLFFSPWCAQASTTQAPSLHHMS